MPEIFKAFGPIAFILLIGAVIIFPLKKKYPFLIKYHPYIGVLGIVCATIHMIGMIYYYTDLAKESFFIFGIISLILLWLIGTAAILLKKGPNKLKGKFFKIHKILGILVFIFIFLHIILAS